MKRKVNLVGPATLTISLPSDWVKKQKIRKGDELDIEEKGNNLIISNKCAVSDKVINISIPLISEKYCREKITKLYREGYSTINISYEDPRVLIRVKSIVENLIGADIIEVGLHSCRIKIFNTAELEMDIKKQIKKIILVIKQMLILLEEDLTHNSKKNFENINNFRYDVLRMKDFILRNAQQNGVDYTTFSNLTYVLYSFEKISRQILFYCKRLRDSHIRIKNAEILKPYFDQLLNMLDWFLQYRHQKDSVIKDEAALKSNITKFCINAFAISNSVNKIDHAFMMLGYYIADQLDGATSYFSSIFYPEQPNDKRM